MSKVRLVLLASFALLAALAVAACGGGGDGGGGSSADLATFAPPGAPVYIEGTIRPDGETAANIDSLAKKLAGIDSIGALLIEELEEDAKNEGEPFDFASEVEPWLGERAAVFLGEYDGDDFEEIGFVVQTTNGDEAFSFVEERGMTDSGEKLETGEVDGTDVLIDPEEELVVGVLDESLVGARGEKTFEAMKTASEGDENLAGEDKFAKTFEQAPDGSVATVYADVGALIEEVGSGISSETQTFFDATGLDPTKATAVASLEPGADEVEIDIASDLSEAGGGAADASSFLEGLPASSVFAFAAGEVGARVEEAIDRLDKTGIPGEVEPGQLREQLDASGIDLESTIGSIGDAGLFVEGTSEADVGGALVLETKGASEAQTTVSNLGLLVRASGTPGVEPVKGAGITGFTIPNENDPTGEPFVLAASGSKAAFGYGEKSTLEALKGGGQTLGSSADFKTAKAALDGTPMLAYVAVPPTVELLDNTGAIEEEDRAGFEKAKPYLEKISYMAIGADESGDYATAKLIVGFNE